MKRIKQFVILVAILGITFLVWSQSYTFNVAKATAHLTAHGRDKSIHCCAWYTMRALQAGGCPAIILPAQWYRYFMPLVRFEEIEVAGYTPQAGDIVVFERPKGRSWKKISQWWGHVAMYNGEQWISDFKQKRMNPYKTNVPYRIYRYKSAAVNSQNRKNGKAMVFFMQENLAE